MNVGIRYPEGRIGRPREFGGRHVRKEREGRHESGLETYLSYENTCSLLQAPAPKQELVHWFKIQTTFEPASDTGEQYVK